MLTTEKMEVAKKSHKLGQNHDSHLANQNGLDEIDLWAMGIGNAERQHNQLRPNRKHATTKVN